MTHPELFARAVYIAVVLGWAAYPVIFFFRPKPPRVEELKRDRRSVLGIVMQGAAFAIVWSLRRPLFTPIVQVSFLLDIGLAVATIAILIASLSITWAALRSLGKQWSFSAQLVKEHSLVVEGPYRIVRHPIYAGMLGLVIAAGLAASHWAAFIGGLVMFLLGTSIRIRSEEKLLREAFGRAYEEYAERVPAIVPFARGF